MTVSFAPIRRGLLFAALFAWPAAAAPADQALIDRGEYLTTAGDCVACHTGPSGAKLAGGHVLDTPLGSFVSPNITPDQDTGIGSWTDDQFYRAMHEGIDDQGKYLYPAFPFPWYTRVTREDALAIKAYLFSLPPVHAPRQPNRLSFPFSVRDAMVGWRVAFFKPETFRPDAAQTDEVNRGAYLVQGLGHCGECHNSNAMFGASDAAGRLQGGQIGGWYAPNITSDGREGIGDWSVDDLAKFLKTGAAPGKGVVLGPMKEVIDSSLSHLTDADLHAIAAYLKAVPPKSSYPEEKVAAGDLRASPGAVVYLNVCASCHQPDGAGVKGVIPALAGNGAVLAKGPENVIRTVLGGLQAGHGLSPMPAVGVAMSDQDVADATNYVRKAWGNAAPAEAGPGDVATLRADTRTPMLGNLEGGCPKIEDAGLAQAIATSFDRFQGMNTGNMLEKIDAHLPPLLATQHKAGPDAIVNALTDAYCPIAMADPSVAAALRPLQLGNFSVLVYGQLRQTQASN